MRKSSCTCITLWFSQNDRPTLAHRLRNVDLVTTVSDYVTQKIRHDFPSIADRVMTTYNGIDAVEFNREKDYRATSQREEKRILYVGVVSPHRGIHVLLDAFKMVVQCYPRVRLDVVGPQHTYPLSEVFDLTNRAAISSVAPWYANDYGSAYRPWRPWQRVLPLSPLVPGPSSTPLKMAKPEFWSPRTMPRHWRGRFSSCSRTILPEKP